MTATERFWSKVDRSGPCWLWTASQKSNGYGQFHPTRNTVRLAHRFAYELTFGRIPSGLQLDHLCRNRRCVNPNHLEPVTPRTNTHRSPIATATVNASKTECANGHPFDKVNTRHTSDGKRRCRTCGREGWHRRKRAALQESAADLLDRMIAEGA